jgi:hypothetical protein
MFFEPEPEPEPTFFTTRLSELQPVALTFLVPGRLALGKLAILDGDPEMGKSLIALDLAAKVSTGRSFPDGVPGAFPPSAVVVLSGEDGLTDTVLPRLRGLGADLDRVFTIDPGEDNDREDLVCFPRHIDQLANTLIESDARLVVIDPIAAFLDRTVNPNDDKSVRRALAPLADLASRYKCAVLLVRNLNKSGGGQALYRGCGSIGFVAACRSAWLVGRDPRQPEQNVLAQVKNNLAPYQPSLAYRVVNRQPQPPLIEWLGTVDRKAGELLAGVPRLQSGVRPHDLAREALEAYLREELRTSAQVRDWARDEGFAERTLRRAKEELSVRSARVYVQGQPHSYWLLPGQELPASISSKAENQASQ